MSDSDPKQAKRKKLGEILIEAGLIQEKDLARALEIQKIKKKRIGQVLIEMGAVDDEKIAKALASQLKLPYIRLTNVTIPKEIIDLVPQDMAEKHLLIPVKEIKKQLVVAMTNPLEYYAIDDLRFIIQMPIFITVAPESDIVAAIHKHYPRKKLEEQFGPDVGLTDGLEIVSQAKEQEQNVQDLLNLTELPPVVRFTNSVLADAIRQKASDIHIEPQNETVVIRYRVDGIMREIMQIDKQVHTSLVSRIKIISTMDISIRRKPQDGRAQVKFGDARYDLRVSTIPTNYGEKVTIRILNPAGGGMSLEDLGFNENDLRHFQEAISKPQGIILVTGPTGSGKSSTLYTALRKLNTPKVNIVTVEDPVEFDIPGINQVQINPKAGITFAAGLRSILRQDPDIVMVGEIRDSETASIAFQAAQTGHLVLSTLHTNDTPSAVTRLLDMGVEGFIIADSLLCVIGQRLVRGICPKCKVVDPLSPKIVEQMAPFYRLDPHQKFWKGLGCEACQFTGYVGRMGIFEVLTITPAIREILDRNVSGVQIRKVAESEGFTVLSKDGLSKAIRGLTTIEEVLRVAPPELEDADDQASAPAVPLPRVGGVTAAVFPETEPEEPLPHSAKTEKIPKILIVDDNVVILKVLRNILESNNFEVVSAINGNEGFKAAHVEKPDLIITDYLMPGLDGKEMIQKLKGQLSTRYIPIIMLTSKDEVDSEVEVIDAGADDYLVKPANPKRLVARIKRLLSRPVMLEME
ncbi:ATPase, T2SS/T4P/T4SS family [Desulfatirhabdium butyrativorans]|uniref:ATPase, T2SS/T4P/T4SS family n=1 Tax=Desulfatirhabdium butyrativorans TaxID=340467 RepID=UPI000402C7E0|nr:ATPase, T2SS/T4P/T4SS family [Desulfatirhabdium butyrativorans]